MNEKGLIEQVLRIINANYSNIYVIDITADLVYTLGFNVANDLVIKDTGTYTDFIDIATRFVHEDELSNYFNAISLSNLELESQKGNNETKVKYRKLCETGEYRWFVNIINYLPFDGKKLIFMMSEDINERLIDSEEDRIKLETEVVNYKIKLDKESESISDAIYQINNLLENGASTGDVLKIRDTREYINSVFNKVSVDHPELNRAIMEKVALSSNYRKPSILIVDDSSIIRNSLKRIFNEDFDLVYAKDGNEAVKILADNVVNVNYMSDSLNIVGVLLDLVMPVADGFVVLDYMKKYNLFNRLPVAIISGDETRETRKKVYQYDIVDMLEKPFNTDNIRRRISKIISLYQSSNNMRNIIVEQSEEIEQSKELEQLEDVKVIINQIVDNVVNSYESNKLKRCVQIIANNLMNKYPKYKLDSKYVDNIVVNAPLYNIGAIAMKDDEVITNATIKKSIDNGLVIASNYVEDESSMRVAENIISEVSELYNGTGYPNGISGDVISIEAQIVSLVVRLCQYNTGKTMVNSIKTIVDKDNKKYNPDLIDILQDSKKELKEIK